MVALQGFAVNTIGTRIFAEKCYGAIIATESVQASAYPASNGTSNIIFFSLISLQSPQFWNDLAFFM